MALKLVAEVALDGSGIARGAEAVRGQMDALAKRIASAFTVGAVVQFARKTIEFAGTITDLSARLGVSTSYLQEMQYVMKQNGGSVDDLTAAFERMGAARIKALEGDAEAQASFAKFGISQEQLKTMRMQDIMDAVAGKFKEFGRNDVLVSAFRELGGRGAGALIPAFVDGIESGKQSARDAGAVIKDEYVAQLDELGDSFDRLSMVLVSQVAPAIIAVMQAAKQLVAGTQGLGAFWGAATANLTVRDLLAMGVRGGASGRAGKGAAFDSAAGTNAEMEIIDAFLKTEDALAKARAEKIARQNAVQEVPEVQSKAAKINKVAAFSDSLVSVGNFLGSGRSTLESVAQKQLKIQERMAASLTDIARALTSTTTGTINVP